MGGKSNLLKNMAIDSFYMLLTCINFDYAYFTLFLNKKQIFSWLIAISTIYAIPFFLVTDLFAYLVIPLLNSINWNLFCKNKILDFNQMEIIWFFLWIISLTFGIFATLFPSGIFSSRSSGSSYQVYIYMDYFLDW